MTLPIETFQPPVSFSECETLITLWSKTFESDFSFLRPALLGQDAQNDDWFFIVRHEESLIATCHLTQASKASHLGGLGEVCVVPEARNQGLATRLCQLACERFFEQGGKHLFLGTENPAARRIYERLGWVQLPCSTVMVNSRDSQWSSLDGLYSNLQGEVRFEPADASIRIPLIPLALARNDLTILDANINLISSTHSLQHSCMGLFVRYETLPQARLVGGWIDNTLIGLASLCFNDEEHACLDAFTSALHLNALPRLLRRALDDAHRFDIPRIMATPGVNDRCKIDALLSLGFESTGKEGSITTQYGQFKTVELQKDISRSSGVA